MSDWSPLIQAASVVVTTVLVPWGIVAYQKRTGVVLTDQQRAAVQASLTTAAGSIETKIAQGMLSVRDVRESHPAVVEAVAAAFRRVPEAAAAQGLTPAAAAEIVVGRISAPPPIIIPPTPPQVGPDQHGVWPVPGSPAGSPAR